MCLQVTGPALTRTKRKYTQRVSTSMCPMPRLVTTQSFPGWMRRFGNKTHKNQPGPRKERRRSVPPSQGFTRVLINHHQVGCTTSVFPKKHLAVDLATTSAAGASVLSAAQKTKPSQLAGRWLQAAEPELGSGRSPTSYHSRGRLGTAIATGRPRTALAPTSTQGCRMKSQHLSQGQRGAPHVRPRPGSDSAAPREAPMAAGGGGSRGPRAPARERGCSHQRQPRGAHSHVVEAEQVIARESPERGHRAAAAAAEAGLPRAPPALPVVALRGSPRGGAGNCFRATSCLATKVATPLPLAAGVWNCSVILVKSPGSHLSEPQNYSAGVTERNR